MTPDEVNTLLAKPLHAIVATSRTVGPPQLTPVWFYWDGAVFSFSTTRDRVKYANIRRNPEIALIVDDIATHAYVAAYGKAGIVEQGAAELTDLTRRILEKYLPDAPERLEAFLRDTSRVIVTLRPERLLSR